MDKDTVQQKTLSARDQLLRLMLIECAQRNGITVHVIQGNCYSNIGVWRQLLTKLAPAFVVGPDDRLYHLITTVHLETEVCTFVDFNAMTIWSSIS